MAFHTRLISHNAELKDRFWENKWFWICCTVSLIALTSITIALLAIFGVFSGEKETRKIAHLYIPRYIEFDSAKEQKLNHEIADLGGRLTGYFRGNQSHRIQETRPIRIIDPARMILRPTCESNNLKSLPYKPKILDKPLDGIIFCLLPMPVSNNSLFEALKASLVITKAQASEFSTAQDIRLKALEHAFNYSVDSDTANISKVLDFFNNSSLASLDSSDIAFNFNYTAILYNSSYNDQYTGELYDVRDNEDKARLLFLKLVNPYDTIAGKLFLKWSEPILQTRILLFESELNDFTVFNTKIVKRLIMLFHLENDQYAPVVVINRHEE